jgi:magnesium chelatase family protein
LDKINLEDKYDFKYILWQSYAKRALEIAASGWHNIIMDWPPGSWKTMLSKSFSGILPDLTIEEAIEVSKIYSISWLLNKNNPIITKRPFRTVHHTASSVSIVWWWRDAKPWEISLSHKWVLFLDEILEFEKSVLEVLRQPLEDWNITINRVNASYNYPAKFILVWAMNPCPCWYLTEASKECICSPRQVENYRSRLSWPLIDRIDIFINVPKVKTEKFKVWENYEKRESSMQIKKRVEKSRELQLQRFKNTNITFNSEMWTKEINKFCILDKDSEKILKQAITNLNLSARSYYKVIKLSRTIADLEWSLNINKNHILEALSFRKKDEN